MRINHNIAALNTYNQLQSSQMKSTKNKEKLSSGLRINRAGDDAAGLAISEKMRGQIRGLEQASTNAQDGISLIQTAEGALNETHAILQRMRELAVQSANDTNTNDDREYLQQEVNQLSDQLIRISEETSFNNQMLLDGTYQGSFQIGANANQQLSVDIEKMGANLLGKVKSLTHEGVIITNATGEDIKIEVLTNGTAQQTTATFKDHVLTINCRNAGTTRMAEDVVRDLKQIPELQAAGLLFEVVPGMERHFVGATNQPLLLPTPRIDISTQVEATLALDTIDLAVASVSAERAKMGAIQNRLEHTINNLSTSAENLTSAESRIRDVDMAKEMMELTKNNVLEQASQAMLAQANQTTQNVLQLLTQLSQLKNSLHTGVL